MTSHIFVKVGKQRVRPFTTTYSILALSGKPNVSLFKPTKSAEELIDVIPAKSRENAGCPVLLRIEGDNPAGDSSLHISASPSLMKDVTPYHDPTKLPRYKI